MRLIDADALPRHGQRGGLVHWQDIENAPTVDAVPVIRCVDCYYCEGEEYPYTYCVLMKCPVPEKGYCHMAKKREEARA